MWCFSLVSFAKINLITQDDHPSDSSFYFHIKFFNTMYLHHPTQDDERYRNTISKELLVPESPLLDPANSLKFLTPGQDEILKFVKTEKPVSAMQYACWWRIVQELLDCNKGAKDAIRPDVELAIICFRKIEKVHRFSSGSYLRKRG